MYRLLRLMHENWFERWALVLALDQAVFDLRYRSDNAITTSIG